MRIVSTTVAALERDAAGGRSTKAAGRVSVADANKVCMLMMNICIHSVITCNVLEECTQLHIAHTSASVRDHLCWRS
jgi:hypothetical protein